MVRVYVVIVTYEMILHDPTIYSHYRNRMSRTEIHNEQKRVGNTKPWGNQSI